MKEVWKKIASKGYMAVTVLLVAVLGTVYFMFLKGDDETAGNMKDINSTTEKIVFPEEEDGPKKEETDEVLLAEQETEVTESAVETSQSETELQPEQNSEKEITAAPIETPEVEETLDNQENVVTSEPELTPTPSISSEPESSKEDTEEELALPPTEQTPEPTPEPVVEATPESTPEPTSEPTVESTPEPTSESTVESTSESTPEPTPETTPEPPKEECVHHWLFESYFQEPTCSSGGLENQICARCGETRTVPGTPTGQHAYVVETEGDCTSAEIVRCDTCNTREVREKDPEKHIDVEDGICYGCGEKVE